MDHLPPISVPDLRAEDPIPSAAPGVVLVQTVRFQAAPYPGRVPAPDDAFLGIFWLRDAQQPVHLPGQRGQCEETAEKAHLTFIRLTRVHRFQKRQNISPALVASFYHKM